MIRLLARIILSALAFTSILPLIHGIDFHGHFAQALMLSVVFALMLWLVDIMAVALSAVATIGTLGVALLWLIPLWILGFWLLPAVALKVVSDIMPRYLTIQGWMPAILGGLVLLIVSLVTSGSLWRGRRVR